MANNKDNLSYLDERYYLCDYRDTSTDYLQELVRRRTKEAHLNHTIMSSKQFSGHHDLSAWSKVKESDGLIQKFLDNTKD